eukprot:14911100-Alexandrium_andersonii.AAC.1
MPREVLGGPLPLVTPLGPGVPGRPGAYRVPAASPFTCAVWALSRSHCAGTPEAQAIAATAAWRRACCWATPDAGLRAAPACGRS